MSQTKTLSYQSQEPEEALSRCSGHSLRVEGVDFEYKSFAGNGGIPASTSNGSLIDFDIDTSDFINMKSPFPWDNSQWPEQSRESILIPEFPHDLAEHRIQACKLRPANLRTSSGDSEIYPLSTECGRPSYKRSVTPSQLDSLAGALEVKSARRTHTPQRSFESIYTQDRPMTPPLSFSSSVASSPASSIMSPSTEPENIPATAFAAVSGTRSTNSRSNPRSSDRCPIGSGPKVQRIISGPLPNTEYPSMMNLTISPFSREIYDSEPAFQPCRKTPKPPSSIPLLLSPATSSTQAEPPSWFDLDDDTSHHSSKHRNLPTKLSIPHLHLRDDPFSKKTMPLPAPTTKRRNEDSITIAANIVDATGVGKPCATSKASAAYISLPPSSRTLVQDKAPQALLKKKSSVRSKLLVTARGCTAENMKRKKSKMVKVGVSSKNKKRSQRRRFQAWFRRLFD